MKKTPQKYDSMREALRALVMASEEANLWRAVEDWGGRIEFEPPREWSAAYYFVHDGQYNTETWPTWREAANAYLAYKSFGVEVTRLPKEVTDD